MSKSDKSTHPPIVDIYCRVAVRDTDSEQRLYEQEETCRRYCDQNGLLVERVHRDIGSGLQLHHAGLTEFRDRATHGAIQGVVMTHLNRLSRSHTQLVSLLDELDQHHVTVHTASEQLKHTLIYQYRRATS